MKQQKKIYPKISFRATTIAWRYGDCMWIGINAVAGCSFYINWGDGKQEMFIGEGKYVSLPHVYYPGVSIPEGDISFRIKIFSNEADCRIIELGGLSHEMILTELDITHCVELEKLWYNCTYRPTILDVSKNVELRELSCSNSWISKLDISNNTKLITLNCASTGLTYLDLSHNPELQDFDFSKCEGLSEVDLSHNTELVMINCENSEIKNLNLSNNTALRYLSCQNNKIKNLNLSKNIALRYLNCEDNEIENLNLSNNAELRYLNCQNNEIKNLDLSNNPALLYLKCQKNWIKNLNLSNNPALQIMKCTRNGMNKLSIAKNSRLKRASFMSGNNIDANIKQKIMNIMKSNPPVDLPEYNEIDDIYLGYTLGGFDICQYLSSK